MSVYQNQGYTHSCFSRPRHSQYDSLGKQNAKKFFSSFYNTELIPYDTKLNRPDFICGIDEVPVLVEVEIKENGIWKYIFEGVDIPLRKLKNLEYAKESNMELWHFMSNPDATKIIITPDTALWLAENSNVIKNDNDKNSDIKIPKHKCYKVYKKCKTFDKSTENNHFFRINLDECSLYAKVKNEYKQITISQAKFLWLSNV